MFCNSLTYTQLTSIVIPPPNTYWEVNSRILDTLALASNHTPLFSFSNLFSRSQKKVTPLRRCNG